MIGRAPQITYEGYVLPCCWIPYEKHLKFTDSEIKQNPFFREDFNLYNAKLSDIIYSQEWNKMLQKIYEDTPKKCKQKCSFFRAYKGKAGIENVSVPKINPSVTNKTEYYKSYSTNGKIFSNSKKQFKRYREIQLETTSRCSLRCPYCQRTTEAGTGKYRKSDLPLSVLSDIFSTKGVELLTDCGRYGDPTFYPQYHDLLDLLVDSPVNYYKVSLAATGHGERWWATTIDKFLRVRKAGTEPIIIFGIDGLKNTSSQHRIGQNFDEIWNAMINCHNAGLKVQWQVIPTSANEHQLEEIKGLARDFGIEILMALSNRWKGENDPLRPGDPNLFN